MTSLKNFNLQHSYIFPFQTISIYFPIFLFISLFLSPLSLSAQSNNHIFGIVTDSLTGEALIGATVAELSSNKATATNNYGYYSLPTTSANPTVQISSMGYNTLSMVINVEANTQTNIKLQPANLQLEEAMVVGKRTSVASPSLGTITFTKENIEYLRNKNIFGEPFLKYLENFKFESAGLYFRVGAKHLAKILREARMLQVFAGNVDADW